MLPPSSVLERTGTEVPGEFLGKGDVLFKIQTFYFSIGHTHKFKVFSYASIFCQLPCDLFEGPWEHKKDAGVFAVEPSPWGSMTGQCKGPGHPSVPDKT